MSKLKAFNSLIAAVSFALLAGIAVGSAPIMAQVNPVPAPPPVPVQPLPLPSVRLTASASAASYPLGAPVTLNINLTNRSATAVGLSNILHGSIVVTSFTRNGVAVPTKPAATEYDDGFAKALSSSLQSIAVGSTLSFPWKSRWNQELNSPVLLTVAYTGDSQGVGTFFALNAPGSYSVSLYYQYTGPKGSFVGTVFTGRTNSVTVTFTVI